MMRFPITFFVIEVRSSLAQHLGGLWFRAIGNSRVSKSCMIEYAALFARKKFAQNVAKNLKVLDCSSRIWEFNLSAKGDGFKYRKCIAQDWNLAEK